MIDGALGHFLVIVKVFILIFDCFAIAVLQASELLLRHNREAISDLKELVDVLLDLVERLQVKNAPVLACIDVREGNLASLASLPLGLLVHTLDVELIAKAEYFALEGDALQSVDLIQFFGDAELISDFERPEDPANVDWYAEAPQVF